MASYHVRWNTYQLVSDINKDNCVHFPEQKKSLPLSAIGAPLVIKSMDKSGLCGITIAIMPMDWCAVFVVNDLKLLDRCGNIKLPGFSNCDSTNMSTCVFP
ncbi:hypothetical protein, partial [Coleofasciculus sp. F4-SAH-05]|uniref:hypothetical protein n=1 Tax=Coleofasciculus sp. F4-SAH-05 TaxID=3069525 RepID=UPI0032F1C8F9